MFRIIVIPIIIITTIPAVLPELGPRGRLVLLVAVDSLQEELELAVQLSALELVPHLQLQDLERH